LPRYALLRLLLSLVPAIGALCVDARAQSESPTEDIFLADLPQILSVTRLPQPLSETPASVTVIDRRTIESSGALDIPDVLRLVPGFQVGHVNGTQTTVTYHGLSDAYARRMQVLVDGRSIYNPFFGGVTWPDLPLALEDIERIEVIRGPNGVAYGANSFSAVINIITRDAADTLGTFVKVTQGSVHTRSGVARYGGGEQDFRYRATVSYRGDRGFPNEEDGKQVRIANWRADIQATERDSLLLQFGYNGGTRDDGALNSTIDPPRKAATVSDFQQLAWKRTSAADEEIKVQFYHNYYRRSDTFHAVSTVPILLTATVDQDVLAERYDLELTQILKPRSDTRLVWGSEARLDRVAGEGWFGTAQTLDYPLYRLFGNAEWRATSDWIFNIGAMVEDNKVTGAVLSPRLAINYHATPTQTLRTSATRSHRTPAIFEDRADSVVRTDQGPTDRFHLGNSELKPERITSYELGYLGEFPELGMIADAKLFHEEIRDVITSGNDTTTTPGDSFERFLNDGHATTNGAELQLTYRATPATRAVYSLSYAHQHGRILKQASPPTYVDTDELTPVHTGSFFIEHRTPHGTTLSAAYYHVSHFSFASPADPTEYSTIDARIAQKIRMGRTRGELAFVGQHLKRDYFDFDRLVAFDKRFFISLSLEAR
jgi:iron complex outermembrane receptor protein